MTEQESIDNKILIERIKEIKINCFERMKDLVRCSEQDLMYQGYRGKTNGEAMVLAFHSYEKDINKLIDAHVRKYPDDGEE